jgi:hypothetical protein
MPLPWIEQEEERASSEALQEAATVCREAEVNLRHSLPAGRDCRND